MEDLCSGGGQSQQNASQCVCHFIPIGFVDSSVIHTGVSEDIEKREMKQEHNGENGKQ